MKIRLLLLIFCAFGGTLRAHAQSGAGKYTIVRSTLDSGGGSANGGGKYVVYTTLGQADATTPAVGGGKYTLYSGFWVPTADGVPTVVGLRSGQAATSPALPLAAATYTLGVLLFGLFAYQRGGRI